MPAPQLVQSTVPGGPGLYYVPPGQQPPNLFASFWHNYLQSRSPYAQAAFKATLAAQSPKDQYAALAAIAKARQAMMVEEGKSARSSQQAAVAAMQQAHADWRSKTAAEASIQGAGIRGNATLGAAKYGYDAARTKAGTIDPSTGGRVLSDFKTRSEAAQLQIADAIEAGDKAGYDQGVLKYQQAVAAARDATGQMNDPLQEDAVAREIQNMAPLVSDPDVQDQLHRTVSGSFGVSREPPIEDLGGVGGRLNLSPTPSLDVGPAGANTSTSTKTRRSVEIADEMRTPRSSSSTPASAGSPGSSPAPLPSPTTSGGSRSRAEGQPGETRTEPSPDSSSSTSRSRDPEASARSSSGDPFSDLEARVTQQRSNVASPADFNFYGRGFGVYGRDREARARSGGGPPTRSRARAEGIADELAVKPTTPKTEPAKGMVDPYGRRQAPVNEPGTLRPNLSGKTVATPVRSEAPPKVMALEQKAVAPGPAKPAGTPKASSSRRKSTTTVKPAAAPQSAPAPPAAQAGAGDVKAAESPTTPRPEQPKRGGGMGDVKVAEARQGPLKGNTLYSTPGDTAEGRRYEKRPDGSYLIHERGGATREVKDGPMRMQIEDDISNGVIKPDAKDSLGDDYVAPKPSGVSRMMNAAYDATAPVREAFPNATSAAEAIASRMVGSVAAEGSPVDELIKRRAAEKARGK